MSQEQIRGKGFSSGILGGILPQEDLQRPNVEELIAESKDESQLITVLNGASDYSLPLVGKTVGWVREKYGEALNIPKDAQAIIEAKQVSDDHVIIAGSQLEWMRELGRKGHIFMR